LPVARPAGTPARRGTFPPSTPTSREDSWTMLKFIGGTIGIIFIIGLLVVIGLLALIF
jgi:hypothetical protein